MTSMRNEVASETRHLQKPMSYSEIKSQLRALPKTWYPALLKYLVEECMKQKVFKPGQIHNFVQKAELGWHSEEYLPLGNRFSIAAERLKDMKSRNKELEDIIAEALMHLDTNYDIDGNSMKDSDAANALNKASNKAKAGGAQ